MRILIKYSVTIDDDQRLALAYHKDRNVTVDSMVKADRKEIVSLFAAYGIVGAQERLAHMVKDYYAAKAIHFEALALSGGDKDPETDAVDLWPDAPDSDETERS